MSSIKTKLLKAHFATTILTILMMAGLTYHLMHQALESAQKEKLETIAFSASYQLEGEARDWGSVLSSVETFDYPDEKGKAPLAGHFAKFRGVLPVLAYLNAEGFEEVKSVRGLPSEDLLDFGKSEAFEKAMENPNRVIYSEIEKSRELGRPAMQLMLARFDGSDGRFLGGLRGVVPMQAVSRILSPWSIGKSGFIVLVDGEGRVLTHPSPEKWFRPLFTGEGENAGALRRLCGGKDLVSRVNLLGTDGFVAGAPLPMLGWSVLVVHPYDEYVEPLLRLQLLSMLIALAAIAAGTFVAYRLGRPLTLNIRSITAHTTRLAGGDLSCRLQVASGDELEILANSVNNLTENLDRANGARDSLDRLVQSIIDPLVVTDEAGSVIRVNPSTLQLLGCEEGTLLGRPATELFDEKSPLARPEDLARLLEKGEVRDFETELRNPSGENIPALFSCSTTGGGAGDGVGFVAIIKDISERKASEKEIVRLAYYDELTGLPNRTLLRNRLDQAILQGKRLNEKLAVLFLDLDHFKVVNDNLGHSTGDRLLRQATGRLQECLRKSDTIARPGGPEEEEGTLARIGGDEFVILLSRVRKAEDVAVVAGKLVEALAAPFQLDQHQVFTPASIGIALYPDDGAESDSLLKHADIAMYHAKSQGRNSYHFFSSTMNEAARERLLIEGCLREDMQCEFRGFSLLYQPKVDADSGRICGMEALLRWSSEKLGAVMPTRFVPVAEETGLIIPLGQWVLETACRQNLAWVKAGYPPMKMAVNLSGRQLRDPGLVDMIAGVLEETGLPASLLELELTESMLMETVEGTISLMHRMKALGLSLAIDDFGTGYSSLSYLKRFPIDTLKIDRAFVSDLEKDPDDGAIVRAIIALAETMSIRVVAEGVETELQLGFLRRSGCDEIQGYLFSKPVSSGDFAKLLHRPEAMTEICFSGAGVGAP